MLNKLIRISLQNRFIVITLAVVLIVAGSLTASKMEVDVFPDFTAPTVVVLTEAHGMAPEEVERLVTFPIETSLNGAEKIRRIRSSSSAGFSIVWAEFNWGMESYRARQVVNEKLGTLTTLPRNASRPVMAPASSIMGEIMFIAVTSDKHNLMDIRSLADWTLRPRLLAIPGVSQVSVIGGEYKQYQVMASPQKMKFYGVSLKELAEACEESSQDAAGGMINEHGNQYIIKGVGRTNKISELGKTVIKVNHGTPVTIDDVAAVQVASAFRIGEGALDGKPAVIMTVMKQAGANTLQLTKTIDSAMEELKQSLPPGMHVRTDIFRQADFIKASVHNIQKTLWEGAFFVMVVLFVFLMNWRATVISLIAIPLSLLAAILALNWMGLTINTMSLGGMAIAIGDLVDDAIIDVENVYKRLMENAERPPGQRSCVLDVIYDASVEIRSSVINATFIIIVAFVPLFFLSGMEGRLLAPLGIAFIVSLFASLVVAVTLTPVLCSFLLTNQKKLEKQSRESWLVAKLGRGYEKSLLLLMKRKVALLTTTFALFLFSLGLLLTFGRSFLPDFNEGSLVITASSLPGISLEESSKIGAEVEKQLLCLPEIRTTSRRTGRAELDEHTQGANTSEIDAPFVLNGRSRADFMKEVRARLRDIPGANFSIGQPISHRIDHMLSGTKSNIAIKVYGNNLNQLYRISNQLRSVLNDVPGLVDVNVEQQVEIPQIQIRPKRDMLALHGITVGDFARFLDVAIAGEKVNELYDTHKRYDLVLRYDSLNQGKFDHIRNAMIDTYTGDKVPLHYVADIVSEAGPNTINRENVERKTVVSANVAGRDQRTVVEEIKTIVENEIKLPEGYRIEYGGQFEAEAEASKNLLLASSLAVVVIFFLLYKEFKSVKTAGVILLNLPLALIGGVFSIWLTSGMLSIPAIIGFITLFGLAIRNGILLVSHYNTLLSQGCSLSETIVRGSKDRLSPILMTALTAGLALIPLAISGDLPGNEIQSPMAKVILGGLISSTFLNLFVVPAVYYLSNRKKLRS